MEIRNELVWNIVFFNYLDLFRISDFEFRVFSLLLIPWRALRLCASYVDSDAPIQNTTERFKSFCWTFMKYLDLSFADPVRNLACDEALGDIFEAADGGEALRLWEPRASSQAR